MDIVGRLIMGEKLQLTTQWLEWECPVHGNVGTTGGVTFNIPNRKSRTYCWMCIEDKIIAAGVCELTVLEQMRDEVKEGLR